MADPFLAEIRIFGFNFAPVNWAMCNGQILPISQNTALFSLVGTFYGGDGKSTFGLPNLQGCAPMNQGQGPGLSDRVIGETAGEENVTLIQSEMPIHTHTANCVDQDGDQYGPPTFLWARDAAGNNEYATTSNASMGPAAIAPQGGDVPHLNMQPYLTLNFCIALQGIFPSRA